MKFLKRVKEAMKDEKFVVIVDNCPAHHSKTTTGWCRDHDIELVFLPAYSPEMNSAIELVWYFLKRLFRRKIIVAKAMNEPTPVSAFVT